MGQKLRRGGEERKKRKEKKEEKFKGKLLRISKLPPGNGGGGKREFITFSRLPLLGGGNQDMCLI